MTRVLDICFSSIGLILLLPFLLIIALCIKLDSRGPVLYRQQRVGKYGRDFGLLKFRSMRTGSDQKGLLTIGGRDSRITKTGYFLRKYKLDELPQLFNVLAGTMSLVGPRPEVRKYVDLYTDAQKKVLGVRPGITDYASIKYRNENELLAQSPDPEKTYIEEVMQEKLLLNLIYIDNPGIRQYFLIIFKTVLPSN